MTPPERMGELLERFTDLADTGMGLLDRDLRFLYVNPTLADINELRVEDHIGGELVEVLGPTAASLAELLRGVIDDGRSVEGLELRMPRSDDPSGPDLVYNASYHPVHGADGQVSAIGVFVVDVTEREEAVDRLRQLIDGLFTFAGLLEPDGTLTEANQTALDVAGLRPADVVDRPFWEAYWWSYDAGVQDRLQAAVRRAGQGEIIRYDVDVRVKGDRLITVDFQLVPILRGGRVEAIVPLGLDISDRVRGVRRAARLADLVRGLSGARSSVEVIEIIRDEAPQLFDSGFANVGLLNVDDELLHLVPADGLAEEIAERHALLPLIGRTPLADAARTGRPVVCRTRGEILVEYPGPTGSDILAAGLGSVVAVPLRRGDGPIIGSLAVGWPDDAPAEPDLLSRIVIAAEICAQALERVRLAEAHAGVLIGLQRRLLSDVPTVVGLEVEVCYEPAESDLTFGGDWYDVARLDTNRTVVVVGDVVGHGVDAAAAMAEARYLFKILTRSHEDPMRVLEAADEFLRAEGSDTMATVALIVVDTAAGTLTSALAGHPPPLLVDLDGSVERVSGGLRPPLGVPSARPRTSVVTPFPLGAVLCAYTDGLVERRSEVLDVGIDALAARVGAGVDVPLEDLAERLRVLPAGETRGDDLAFALVRRVAP